MKVAIIISGYLRSFKSNIKNFQEKILNNFDKVDVYLHLTKDEKYDKYLNNNNDTDLKFITNILSPKVILKEPNYLFSKNPQKNNLYNTWYKLYKLNLLKKENERYFGKYDYVIRYRPDIFMETNITHELCDELTIPQDSKIDKHKLSKESDPYVCDIFAIGSSENMDYYFSIFENLNDLIEGYGEVSETLLFYHLEKINYNQKVIDYNILLSTCNTFAICGDSGSGKTTLGDKLKNLFSNSFMLECDRYHKWERGDTKWNSFTHLNPDANYIAKMNDDIFDLKIGNDVYQVDYNHSTGKFTQKEKIESPDNLIVCGLHSLYHSHENLYDLKIYMDTDLNLRKKWKIIRDTKKRGYTVEKVLEQINKRQEDYKKYIEKQKDKSDIIINFYSDSHLAMNDNEEDIDLRLRVLINNKLKVDLIIEQLLNEKIQFEVSSEKLFTTLNFERYRNFSKTKIYNQYHDYYDYIVFIIMNLNQTT